MPDAPNNDNSIEEAPSKSARKRHMHALQALGESLLELHPKQLADIPIQDEELLIALQECRNIRSHSARKRHLQLIGKLMRRVDPEPIESALAQLHQRQVQDTQNFHVLEAMRDELLSQGTDGIEKIVERWPFADRQHLRQLVLQHKREMARSKPPAASRKLFRYLRELHDI